MLTRRHLLASAAAATCAGLPFPAVAAPSGWRRFAVTVRLDVADQGGGPAQAWIPLAGFAASDWSRPEGNSWTAGPNATLTAVRADDAELLHVVWGPGPRFAEVTSIVSTRDRAVDWASPAGGAALPDGERARLLQGTALAPVDGIVKTTADAITAGVPDDLGKARALYAWVVEHTARVAAVPGCGDGNVRRMLETGQLGGKCADINPLFVALARASGLPARELYGVRVAASRLGYASLGPSTPTVTKAQHCRSEVFLDRYGWVSMDPADVRKVMLEEVPGGLSAEAPKVVAARTRLFGAEEGNWIPFNAAHDIALPGRAGRVPFLMYPQVETAAGLADCYRPDQVRYTMEAREFAA